MPINRSCYKILNAVRSNKTFPSVFVILLICISSVTILYKEFFFFSTTIWSMNSNIPLENLAPLMRDWAREYDGIETYCLYILVLISIFLSFLILCIYKVLSSRAENFIYKISYYFLVFFLLLNACIFFIYIGFNPPMACPLLNVRTFLFAIIASVIIYLLFKVAGRFEKISVWFVPIILIPFCFFATMPIYLMNYCFIFAPALRMIHHFKLSEIYFQYDLLLSLLAVLWMKLDLDLNYFQVLGQLSIYLFLLLSFFWSRRFFLKKELSFYLLAALVLIKIYGLICDPVFAFQVTPLRLDWWILLIILTYEKGLYSKWTGLALGFLIIFHRTFGIIYAISYLETAFILLLSDFIQNIPTCPLKAAFKKHFKCNMVNGVIIASAWAISTLLFGVSLESASLYQSIGIGFLPILDTSFYWYVIVMICAASIYLFKLREKLPDGYFAAGSFLIFLAIGNSIYFFGRSHENNILNVAASLVFILFMLFDLLMFEHSGAGEKNALKRVLVAVLPNIFILLLLIFYSGRIYAVTVIKIHNIKKLQFVCPMAASFDTKQIKELTNSSAKVYFAGDSDFYYYYYGGYVPQGRFSPYASWIFKKEIVVFMQDLLDKGYYIVFLDTKNDELLPDLKYNKIVEKGELKVIRE